MEDVLRTSLHSSAIKGRTSVSTISKNSWYFVNFPLTYENSSRTRSRISTPQRRQTWRTLTSIKKAAHSTRHPASTTSAQPSLTRPNSYTLIRLQKTRRSQATSTPSTAMVATSLGEGQGTVTTDTLPRSNRPARHLVAPIATLVRTHALDNSSNVQAPPQQEAAIINRNFRPAASTVEMETPEYVQDLNALHTQMPLHV